MADKELATSKTCSKCKFLKPLFEFHVDRTGRTPDGHRRQCKECHNASNKVYYSKKPKKPKKTPLTPSERTARYNARHPERVAARRKAAREKDPAKYAAACLKWRQENPDKVSEYTKEYEAARRDERTEQRRADYAADPEKFREISRDWGKKNPKKTLIQKHRRRARKRNAEGSYTEEEINALLVEQGHLCGNPYCRADLRITDKTVDHVVALSRGGSNWITNLKWLCRPCNSRKSNLTEKVWLQREAKRNKAGNIIMNLYVANCSKQDTHFIYLLVESGRRVNNILIPQGGQRMLTGMTTKDIEATIEHHRRYGARDVSELNRQAAFAGIIYSEKEISFDNVERAVEHNIEALKEIGKDLRAAAAIVADQTVLGASAEGTTLKATHVDVVEVAPKDKPDYDTSINTETTVRPKPNEQFQDRRGKQRPDRAAVR